MALSQLNHIAPGTVSRSACLRPWSLGSSPFSSEAKGEECLKALLKETTKLRYRAVWDESLVEEWSAVRKQDPNATCGRVFSILEEKNAERHDPEGEREYKALIVRRERDSNRLRRCLALVVSRDVQRPGCDDIH